MKKSTLAFLLILLMVGGYILYDSGWGRSVLLNFFSEDLGRIEEISLAFMEDIQYKDFQSAAEYHSPEDQEKADIPKMIERMFKIKPELLDMMEYSILESSLDSSKTRGRVKMKSKVNVLNSGKIKNPEFILYYHKEGEMWYMDLESSLQG